MLPLDVLRAESTARQSHSEVSAEPVDDIISSTLVNQDQGKASPLRELRSYQPTNEMTLDGRIGSGLIGRFQSQRAHPFVIKGYDPAMTEKPSRWRVRSVGERVSRISRRSTARWSWRTITCADQ
jgi:hypothetical protein